MEVNKSRDLLLKALKVKVLTPDDVLEMDYPQLAGFINRLYHEYLSGNMRHLLAITVNQSGRLEIVSDVFRAGQILIMEKAKLSVIRGTEDCDLYDLLPDEEDPEDG